MTQIQISKRAKYLEITLDTKMRYWSHIKKSLDNAAKMATAVSQLMANMIGLKPCICELLMTVVHSIFLSGAKISADAMLVKKFRKAMTSVQRKGALQIAFTVLEAAVMVIAETVPMDILALEKKRVNKSIKKLGKRRAVENEKARTITE